MNKQLLENAPSTSSSGTMLGRVRSGVAWNITGQVAQQVLRLGFSVALARLLTPRDFGLLGMVGVFTGFAGIFVTMGLGQAIIQRQTLSTKHLSTALTLSLLSAVVIACVLWSSAGYIAVLYREPVVAPLLRVLSFQFLLSATGVVHSSLLQREMRFRELALIELAAFITGSSLAVLLAWIGWGTWSLVFNSLAFAGVQTFLFWRLSGWKPSIGFDRAVARELWSFGGYLMGFNLLNYWARNADNYLIGKYCGASDLGLYGRAYHFMMLPVSNISRVIANVLYPAMCRLQDDRERFVRVLLRMHRAIAVLAFPLIVGLVMLSTPLVLFLFGNRWLGMVPILQVLLIAALGQVFSQQGLVFNSLGRADLTFKVGATNSVFIVASFVAGLPWGALGVAKAYVVVWWLIVFPYSWERAGQLLGLHFWHIAWNVRKPFVGAIVMGVPTWLVWQALRVSQPPFVQLLLPTAVGVVVYWLFLRIFARDLYAEVWEVVRGRKE